MGVVIIALVILVWLAAALIVAGFVVDEPFVSGLGFGLLIVAAFLKYFV